MRMEEGDWAAAASWHWAMRGESPPTARAAVVLSNARRGKFTESLGCCLMRPRHYFTRDGIRANEDATYHSRPGLAAAFRGVRPYSGQEAIAQRSSIQ